MPSSHAPQLGHRREPHTYVQTGWSDAEQYFFAAPSGSGLRMMGAAAKSLAHAHSHDDAFMAIATVATAQEEEMKQLPALEPIQVSAVARLHRVHHTGAFF